MVKGPQGPMSEIPQTRNEQPDKQMERQIVWRLNKTHEQKEMDRPKNSARKAAARSRLTPKQKAAVSAREVLRRASILTAMNSECKVAARVRRNRAGDANRHALRGSLDTYCSCVGCTVCGGPTGKLCVEERVILLEMKSACSKANQDLGVLMCLGGSLKQNSPAWVARVDAAIKEAREALENVFMRDPLAYLSHNNCWTAKPVCLNTSDYDNHLEWIRL